MKIGDKVLFPEDNHIHYGQDMAFWTYLPHDRVFTVDALLHNGERYKLVATGYGILGGLPNYGNGAVYVSAKDADPHHLSEELYEVYIKQQEVINEIANKAEEFRLFFLSLTDKQREYIRTNPDLVKAWADKIPEKIS